jgi:SAM-dependent methyltransferase
VRGEYAQQGVAGFYEKEGASYQNPHEARVRAALYLALERHPVAPTARVLDLCCGSGEVTLALRARGFENVVGSDPFTLEAYERRTGAKALRLDFVDIANGALVCSYALHLAVPSRLPELVWQLSRSASRLFVLSPHKRPLLRAEWGFALKDELLHARTRVRVYERA